MITATTRMSQNGQIVIPKEIRDQAKWKKGTQFLLIGAGDHVLLKKIDEHAFEKEAVLLESIARSEENFRKGEYITLSMDKLTFEEFDRIMMDEKRWNSLLAKNSNEPLVRSLMAQRGNASSKPFRRSKSGQR